MHTIDDSQNNVTIHHNADWSGAIILSWDSGSADLDGDDLTAGKLTLIKGQMPPPAVSHRAVALAVENYLRSIIVNACDDMLISRDLSGKHQRHQRKPGKHQRHQRKP